MADIRNSLFANPWRDAMVPASYRGALFHVEASSRENGRRIVQHEFPKRDIPYAEDMGRRAFAFTVRAYCIAYPHDKDRSLLYRRDYRISRDRLIEQLEREGAGDLQLPLLGKMSVVVERYRVTEEEKLGGFCSFDITFVEAGYQLPPDVNSRQQVIDAATNLTERVIDVFNDPSSMAGADVTPNAPVHNGKT